LISFNIIIYNTFHDFTVLLYLQFTGDLGYYMSLGITVRICVESSQVWDFFIKFVTWQ